MIYRFEPFELNARTSELQPVPYFVVSRTVCIPLRPGSPLALPRPLSGKIELL